jgi:phosphatidylserine decarboxylase
VREEDSSPSRPRHPRIPIAPEGWPFIVPFALTGAALWAFGWRRAGLLVGAGAAACAGFFRDPERTPPRRAGAMLAPADGEVMEIKDVDDAFVGPATRVAIFLSPLDVHINRAPVSGRVTDVVHVPGRFLGAYRREASDLNERTVVRIEGDDGRVAVSQIAGVVARRVVCRLRPGDRVQAGERFGMIRFGSRTDLVVPRSSAIHVRVGQHVVGGETVTGTFSASMGPGEEER